MSLGSAAETRAVFQSLIDQFEFGRIKGFRHASIKAKLPKYTDLKVADEDLASGAIYDGPYEGYSDAELMEVLEEEIARPDWYDLRNHRAQALTNLFRGQLLHFRHLDSEYHLPPGTSKRLLEEVVVERYPAAVRLETDNTIRFYHVKDD
jgi:hypothetical protein